MSAPTIAAFEWDREFSKTEINRVLSIAQNEFDQAWARFPNHVEQDFIGKGGVGSTLPVEKIASKLAPEKFELFGSSDRYFTLGVTVLYSPVTTIPVYIGLTRNTNFFSASFEFETLSVFYEGIPVHREAELYRGGKLPKNDEELESDWTEHFRPAWTENGKVILNVVEQIQKEFPPDRSKISPEIQHPGEHAKIDLANVMMFAEAV